MRFARFSLPIFLFFCVPGWAQQAQPLTALPPAPKAPQALSILNQALTVAGGVQVINAITDYTATGNVTYHWNPEVQGTVTIIGRGMDQFRQDANLPTGLRSSAVINGATSLKSEDGSLQQVSTIAPLSPGSLVFPWTLLAGGVNGSWLGLTYVGVIRER